MHDPVLRRRRGRAPSPARPATPSTSPTRPAARWPACGWTTSAASPQHGDRPPARRGGGQRRRPLRQHHRGRQPGRPVRRSSPRPAPTRTTTRATGSAPGTTTTATRTLSGGAVTSPYGDIAFTNLPYITDAGASCGAGLRQPAPAPSTASPSWRATSTPRRSPTRTRPAAGHRLQRLRDRRQVRLDHARDQRRRRQTSPSTTGTFAVQTTWANDGNGGAGSCEGSHPIVTNPAATPSRSPTRATRPAPSAPRSACRSTPPTRRPARRSPTAPPGCPPGLSINASHRPDLRHPDHGRHLHGHGDRHRHHRAPPGRATFTWTINPAGGNTVTVTNPGNQTGTVGTAVSLQIHATDSAVRPDAHLQRHRAARRACRSTPPPA